ncbi:hypothetical protein ACFC1L_44450, partial [Streptomyces sp. NPDC056210]
ATPAVGQPAEPRPATVPCGQCGAPWSDSHGAHAGDPCKPSPAVGQPAEAQATDEAPADTTAAIEMWARLLNAADVHVNDGDHPTWQQLSTTPGRGQDEYRKAARWLLPRLTTAPAAGQPADAPLTAAERKFLHFALDEAANEMSLGDGFTDEDEAALDRLRLLAGKDER